MTASNDIVGINLEQKLFRDFKFGGQSDRVSRV